jgi:hypothetical protein
VDCQSGFFPEEISPKRNFKFFQKKRCGFGDFQSPGWREKKLN